MTTWLVRHGQSASNAGLPAAGNADVPLTALGIEQSRALAGRLGRAPDLLVVSPFLRARATGEEILRRWPATPLATWPIHELTYLSPARCSGTTAATRQPMIEAYWRRCDPHHLDGADAESFAAFVARLEAFHERLLALDRGFVVAVGHGQFFKAYLFGLTQGFAVSAEWMARYRANEVGSPMANGEVVELAAHQLSRWRTTIMGSAST